MSGAAQKVVSIADLPVRNLSQKFYRYLYNNIYIWKFKGVFAKYVSGQKFLFLLSLYIFSRTSYSDPFDTNFIFYSLPVLVLCSIDNNGL